MTKLRIDDWLRRIRLGGFEEQPVADATLSDLDPLLMRPLVRPEQGPIERQLQRLHLATELDGEWRPTVAGVLLCAYQPQQWLRNAEIVAVAYRGARNDPNEQIDAREIGGPLDRQIWDALHFVRRNMRVPARKELGRVEMPQYSERAVFEAVVNAVAHRDYALHGSRIRLFLFEDRLELYSPGALPNSMSIEAMTEMSMPRNDVLCSCVFPLLPGTGTWARTGISDGPARLRGGDHSFGKRKAVRTTPRVRKSGRSRIAADPLSRYAAVGEPMSTPSSEASPLSIRPV